MSTIIPNLTDGIDTVRNDTGEDPLLKSLPSFVSLLTWMEKALYRFPLCTKGCWAVSWLLPWIPHSCSYPCTSLMTPKIAKNYPWNKITLSCEPLLSGKSSQQWLGVRCEKHHLLLHALCHLPRNITLSPLKVFQHSLPRYFLLLEASSMFSKSISYFSLSFLLKNSFEPWEYVTHYINTKSLCFEIGMHCFLGLGKLICPH